MRYILLLLSVLFYTQLVGEEFKKVYKFDIKEEIAAPVWHTTQKAFKEARGARVDYILIHMNTYGGQVDIADSIRTIILNSDIPVFVFIDNNAASAGALISIACDKIYMRKGGSIGAATVVNQTGEAMPDKYQSYMRSKMRATAEAMGKDPDIAEAMVDPSVVIPGIIDSGKVLTFTTSEAIKYNYCDGEAENIDEVLKAAGVEYYQLIEHQMTTIDKIINILINPAISSLLIMIMIGGIYFELQTPGIGFPIGAAILAAILYFAPLYLEGMAENWEIILFILGIILIALEVFVVPGFGITGISGIALVIVGLGLSLVGNKGLDFSFTPDPALVIARSMSLVVISLFSALILSVVLGKKLLTSTNTPFSAFALSATLKKDSGFVGVDPEDVKLIGKIGIAHTQLMPGGSILIEENLHDAIAESGFIEKGKKVKVIKRSTAQIVVREIIA